MISIMKNFIQNNNIDYNGGVCGATLGGNFRKGISEEVACKLSLEKKAPTMPTSERRAI